MSSLGGSWRVLRRQLAGSALGTEIDRLLQRLKPETPPEHWDNLLKKLEKAVARISGENPAAAAAARVASAPEPADKAADPTDKTIEPVTKGARAQGSAPSLAPSVPSHVKDISLEGLWAGLRLKKDLTLGNVSHPPGWKTNKPVVTKTSIHSRTAYVISALVEARSAVCLAKRTEDFVQHIQTYPEARDLAVKEGAVRVLLRVQRQHAAESEVWGAVNEALALVGWCPPPGGRGPRILALDGGGVRGVVAIEILRHLEAVAERPVRELFDLVVGVSTGAIIAAVVAGAARGDLSAAAALYRSLSRDMFGNTSVLGGASRLVWTQAYYDTPAWEQLLRTYLGEERVTRAARRGPRLALVSARSTGGGSRLTPYVFRSYAGRYRVRPALPGGSDALVWHAVRASAAAPTYFEEFAHLGEVHLDGGLLVNNPAGVALLEARLQYGDLSGATLVSLGCGRAAPAPPPPGAAPAAGTSWRDKFNAVLDSATDTEATHLLLNELLPRGGYYRVNPPLSAPVAMDEVRAERLQAALDDTHAYIRRNGDKLAAAARALSAPRSVLQRAADAAHHRALLLGLTH